jgi:Family of unknown function (DUF6326)
MQQKFKDFEVNTKIILSGLWASVTLCYLYGDYFELYVPKKVEGLINGDNNLDTPTKLFIATFLLALPALMVFLSLILKPTINRLLNIVLGAFFTIFVGLVGISSIDEWHTFYVFLAFIEVIITSIIIYSAWTWEKIEKK